MICSLKRSSVAAMTVGGWRRFFQRQ
jgi:hypothetical protein